MTPPITEARSERYLYGLLPPRDAVVAEMERYARRHAVPIVGPAVGRLFYLVARLHRPRRIFEMGSAIGYSTLWWARGAGPRAEIHYTDGNPANAARARGYLKRAGLASQVRFHTGDARRVIGDVGGRFDLVFIDVDKEQYPEALRKALPRLRRGGLLVADNTLWSGCAARPLHAGDEQTKGIKRFNHLTFSSRRLFPVLLPLRDGVTIAQKL